METGQRVAGHMEALLNEMHQRLPETYVVVMAILPKASLTALHALPAPIVWPQYVSAWPSACLADQQITRTALPAHL